MMAGFDFCPALTRALWHRSRMIRCLLGGALLFLASGCLADVEGIEPISEGAALVTAQEVAKLEALIRARVASPSNGAVARLAERRATNMTLDQAEDLARKQNLTIKAQHYRVDQSKLGTVQSAAVFDPFIASSVRLTETQFASRTALTNRLREKDIDFEQLEEDFTNIAEGNPPEESDICLIVDGEVINEDTCTSTTEISVRTEFASFHADPTDTVTASLDVSKFAKWGGSLSAGVSAKYREKNGYTFPGLDAQFSADDPLANGTRYRWSSNFSLAFATPLPFSKNFGYLGNTANVNLQVAEESEERAHWGYGVSINSVVADAQRRYWTLVRRALELRAAMRHRITLGEQLKRSQRLFDNQQITEYELRQAQATFENLRNVEEAAWGEYAKASNVLTELLDMGRDSYLVPSGYANRLYATHDVDAGTIMARAYENRPELKVSMSEVRTSNLVYQNRKIQTRPDLQLVISYTLSQSDQVLGYPGLDDSLENLFDPDSDNAFIGVFYRRPFGNVAAKSQRSQARLRKQQAEQRHELTRVQITEEVNSALAALWARESEIELTRINLELADQAYQSGLRLREVGTITEFDVLQNFDSLLDARLAHIEALTAYQSAYVDLAEAQGSFADYLER